MRDRDYEETGVGLHNDGSVTVRRAVMAEGVVDGRAAAFFTPRAYKRLNDEAQQVIADLQAIAGQMHALQGHLDEHVTEARSLGASWDLIGWSVGTTGEGARKRWGDQ